MPIPDESLVELTALSGVALAFDSLPEARDEICRIAVRVVPGGDGASLTSFSEKGPRAVAASDEWARGLDELQYDEHEGHCYDAARTGVIFRVRDTEADPRWPSYLPRAVAAGARSLLSLPMVSETKTIGALNVYAREPDAFDAEAVSLAEIIAGHANLASQVAATLFQHRELAAGLREAMRSRAPIEQAKGIIMATMRCDEDTAFARLVEQSQHENRKVRDIALALVARYAGPPPG